MDNGDNKSEILELREIVNRYLRFRCLARDVAREARETAQEFTSIATGRASGITTAQQMSDALDIYSQSLITVKEIDAVILALLEPHEIKFVHSCAILRKEIRGLFDLADDIANKDADFILSIEDEGIVDIIFEADGTEVAEI